MTDTLKDIIEKNNIMELSELSEKTKSVNPKDTMWIFRGLRTVDHNLTSSLERACKSYNRNIKEHGCVIEDILLREFKRRIHQYESHLPASEDTIEWLSLMQHYGAPTRLIDWTYSAYVALYFSLRGYNENDSDHVLWAINLRWLQKTSHDLITQHNAYKDLKNGDKEKIDRFFLDTPNEEDKKYAWNWIKLTKENEYEWNKPEEYKKIIIPATPFKLNQRLTIQKGLFLTIVDANKTFYEVLCEMQGFDDGYSNSFDKNIFQFTIKEKKRLDFLRELLNMNVSSDTLFPGLQGFAESLTVYHHRLKEID